MKPKVLLLVALLLSSVNGQAAPRPKLEVPHAATAPRVDADLTDPAWSHAALISQLGLSVGPDAQGKNPYPTQVRVLWDERFLYVRFECRDDEIYAPFPGGEASRDARHYLGDVAEVFLDPVGDARQYIELEISPRNGIFDALTLLTAKAKSDPDGVLKRDILDRDLWAFESWNLEGLRSAAAPWKDGRGWTADLALPAAPLLKRLGLTAWKPLKLRANFLRYEWPLKDGQRTLVAMN